LSDLAQITAIVLRGRGIEPKQATRVLQHLDEAREVRVLILDARGNVVFDSQGAWKGQSFLEGAHSERDAEGNLRGTFNDAEGRTWLFVALTRPDDSASQMLAFTSLQPRGAVLNWARDNLMAPLLWAGVAALILSTLLALLLGRSVARPVRQVADAATALAQGETGTRAPVAGPGEVQVLARTFNAMADEVEAAQRSQRDFVANVSHEMKTPLTSIQGFSQAILDGTAAEPAAVARAAGVIHEEAERMRRMVDDLLILARFDAGQVKIAREPVELGQLLRGCVEKLAPQAERAGVTVEINLSKKLFALGDADQLGQVFTNLLDNALVHTLSGGRVTVAARDKGGSKTEKAVEVTVTDTGAGIPSEELPRIFERFYRADKARRRTGGVGLGLAIAKEIVVAHGGTIAAESVVGLGSRFIVRLPAVNDEPSSDAR
jgi:signal transduction histidine kinase